MAESFGMWESVEFPWGVGVRRVDGPYEILIFKNGEELIVEGMDVILHDNGIEFGTYAEVILN